jgi:hypothetical protein
MHALLCLLGSLADACVVGESLLQAACDRARCQPQAGRACCAKLKPHTAQVAAPQHPRTAHLCTPGAGGAITIGEGHPIERIRVDVKLCELGVVVITPCDCHIACDTPRDKRAQVPVRHQVLRDGLVGAAHSGRHVLERTAAAGAVDAERQVGDNDRVSCSGTSRSSGPQVDDIVGVPGSHIVLDASRG